MAAFRFIHSSDLHLGKGFGVLPEELRGRLVEARFEAISRLGRAAADHGAGHVLIAGDLFDTTGPSDRVRRQAATAMSAVGDLHWWIIPGNHDSLQGEELWAAFEAEAGQNVHLLRDPRPVEMAQGVFLLPAPLPRQFPGTDLTAWMAGAETPEGPLRIGLAHGGVVSFGEDFDSSAQIPPDRARTARLDYLALGDWHGHLQIDARTFYSGAPERDRFKHGGRGLCLAVTIDAPGAAPRVEPLETGRFDWRALGLALSPGMDAAAELEGLLPRDRAALRDTLVQVRASGFLRMTERAAFEETVQRIAPDLAHLELRDEGLVTEYEADDLDLIATGGALRAAAEELRAEAERDEGSAEVRRVAQAALNRLWSLVREG